MRKLLLCWAMAGSHLLNAQDSLDFVRTKVQQLFRPVTVTYPTRTFIELGDDLVQIPELNDGKKIMDIVQFSMIHHSIRSAQPLDRKWSDLQSPIDILNSQPRTRVPIALLDANVSMLNPDALVNGTLSYSGGQFFPSGVSFFSDRHVMEMSSTRLTAEGPDVELVFPESLWFSDQQSGSLLVQIKTETAWADITKGSSFWLRDLPEGEHKVQYRIISGADTSLGMTSFRTILPSVQWDFIEWIIPRSFNRHEGGRVTIQLAQSNQSGHVRNPIIMVEGIDYNKVAPDLVGGNSDWKRLQSLFLKLSLFPINEYDLIYLDFGDGAAAIEDNAEVLRDLIALVNQDKVQSGSTTPNVVIGHSMGGLVARYCLSKMAKEGFDSQTTKLFTHDSPHNGAHLPLGLQYLFHGLNAAAAKIPFVPFSNQAHKMLSAPASVQMLKFRATSLNHYEENTWLDQVYRPMVSFSDGSQPFELVTTSLGSECGHIDQNPAQTYFNFDFSLERLFSDGGHLVSILTRSTAWRLKVLAKAQSAEGSSEVLKLSLRVDKKFFNGFIQIGANVISLSASSPASLPRLDFVPGGIYFLSEMGHQFLGGLTTPNLAVFLNSGLTSSFTFIPVISALDMPGLDNQAYFKAYNPWMSNLASARLGRFRAAEPLGELKNYSHTYLSNLQAKLIAHKILNLPYTDFCPLECTPDATIAGPLAICPGSDASYHVQTTGGDNLQYQWSGSGGIVFDGQTTDGTASFSVDPGSPAAAMQINCAVYKNGCFTTTSLGIDGTTNLAPITVRCGSAPNVTTPGTALCQNSPLGRYFYIESIPIGSNYTITWTPLPDDNGLLPIIEPYMSQGAFRNAFVKTNGVSMLRFRVDIISDCGSRSKDFEIPYNSLIGGSACILCDQGEFARVEPPIVKEGTEMEVLVIKPGEGLGTVEIRSLEGELLVSKTSGNESESLDVSQLEAGSYVVRIQNPETGTWEEKPLEVKPDHFMTINPNPGSDLIQLGFEGAENSNTWRVTVVDRFGTVRYDQTLPFQPDGVNVQSLQPDLYLFKVENGPQVYQTWFRKN